MVTTSDDSPLGLVGWLLVATRGPDGAGEVVLRIRGGRETYLAWSADPLPRRTQVLVVHRRGPRTVDVVPWQDPVAASEPPR